MNYTPRYRKFVHLRVVPTSQLVARRRELSNLMYEHPSLGTEWIEVQNEDLLIKAELDRRGQES